MQESKQYIPFTFSCNFALDKIQTAMFLWLTDISICL